MTRWIAIAIFAISVGVLLWWGPIEQPQSYHQFGGPRWWLVVSNVPLMVVGIWALWSIRATWQLIFAIGLICIGVGSIVYHWNPNDFTLFWDRLPMAITFMALFSGVIGRWLWPLLVVGVASVVVWLTTGDLRLYVLVQFYPAVVIPILAWKNRWLMAAIGWFVLAKGFEMADWYYGLGGHGVKHLLVAIAAYCVIKGSLKTSGGRV